MKLFLGQLCKDGSCLGKTQPRNLGPCSEVLGAGCWVPGAGGGVCGGAGREKPGALTLGNISAGNLQDLLEKPRYRRRESADSQRTKKLMEA